MTTRSEAVSAGMKAYWAREGTKQRRRAAAKRRRRVRRVEAQLAYLGRIPADDLTEEGAARIAALRAELEELQQQQ